jgi:hypothetical protein
MGLANKEGQKQWTIKSKEIFAYRDCLFANSYDEEKTPSARAFYQINLQSCMEKSAINGIYVYCFLLHIYCTHS